MNDLSRAAILAEQALQRGLDQLQQRELPAAHESLREALQHPATRLAAHNLIERHALQGNFAQMMGLNCEISPADDIFRFFANHPTSANPLRDYLADGWRTLSELMVLLEAVDRPLLKTSRFLEFASGHGRFTRHLVKALGSERVTVSDVVPDAVDFSRTTFGVRGFVSSVRPEDVQWPARYDVVFVLSLFSHLPRRTWLPWLERLYEALAPGGLLVFSTHGLKAARHDSVALDAEGFAFWPSSESQAIDAQEYGTAFTSEEFVLARIAESMGLDKLVHRATVHFWNHQDAYVLRHP
jgi:SAM-dependent methyltransferase